MSMAMPVSAAIRRPGRMSGRLPHTGHHAWTRNVLAAATSDMATRAAQRPDTSPDLLPPQATGRLKQGEQARCPAAMATPATRAGAGAVLRGHCRTVLLWPSAHAVQVPDTADALPRPVSAQR